MKKSIPVFLLCIYISAGLLGNGKKDSVNLKQGDNVPNMHIAAWLNGEPLHQFAPHQTFVIEFTELHCIPCRKNIPHMNRLAEQFKGKVKFASIFIWENNLLRAGDTSYIAEVRKSIRSMKTRINFSVGIDMPSQATADGWMKKAGLDGVPTVFIINKSSKIAWIGNPEELDSSLIARVLIGHFDIAASAAELEKSRLQMEGCLESIFALKEKDFSAALRKMDSLINSNPGMTRLFFNKFKLMADTGYPGTYSWLQGLLDGHPTNMDWYHLFYDMMRQKTPDYSVAIAVAQRAFEEAEDKALGANALNEKAEALYKAGEEQKSITALEQAVSYARDSGNKDLVAIMMGQLLFYKNRLIDKP